MHLPTAARGPVRSAFYGALLVGLLLVPTLIGFAVADAGTTRPPDPATTTRPPTGSSGATAAAAPQTAIQAPAGDAPSSAEDALSRQDGDVAGIPRLRYISPETGEVRIDNGDSVPLGGGLELAVSIAPFPPSDFHVDVGMELTRDGRPVTDASIDTIWDMIFMNHGPFETEILHFGDGAYRASYDFFMFGPWQLDTTVRVPESDPIDFAVSVYVWPA